MMMGQTQHQLILFSLCEEAVGRDPVLDLIHGSRHIVPHVSETALGKMRGKHRREPPGRYTSLVA